MNKTILITGGAGFIGSNFIHLLIKHYHNYRIINFDKLTYAGNLNNLKGVESNPNYEFIQGDISSSSDLESFFTKKSINYVINFAAESHVDRSIHDSSSFIHTNILGTHNLLNISKQFNVEKFIQVSTDEVYGSIEKGRFTELSNYMPNSPYAASKASADMICRSFYKTFNFPVMVTRCSNNYGPYQFPEKLIPLVINNAINNKKIPLYGDGLNVRDWIHVEDHCRGIAKVLEKGQPGEIYNFGGDSEVTNLNIIKIILEILNCNEDLIEYVKDRPGHDKRYAIDFKKAKKDLNWTPKISFSEGLEKTVNWYVNNSFWLNSVISGDYKNYYNLQYH